MTSIKEINLEEEEARKLATASKEVLKFYPLGMSDKALAWINLGVVATGIYGTRIMAYSLRRETERRARRAAAPAAAAPAGQAPSASPGPAARPVNGQAAHFNLDDLTPAWMAAPPEGEIIP